MKKAILIFSHKLTDIQKLELKDYFECGVNIALPIDLQELWSQVPTASTEEELGEYILPLLDFMDNNSTKNDIVFVQGDYGMTFLVANWCLKNKRVPVYATTERKAVEVTRKDGSIELKHTFIHAGFRKYETITEERI